MAGISLRDYQTDAVERMKNGCILCGGVGSGKSRTALAYYYKQNGGKLGTKSYIRMPGTPGTISGSMQRLRMRSLYLTSSVLLVQEHGLRHS